MSEATTPEAPSSAAPTTPAVEIGASSSIPPARILVWALFFISGACGLVYEVLWCRQLGLLFGNTAYSLSAVLTAFMSGLALGSFVSGRICHRIKRPLYVYGVLELLIGLYCALLPWLFGDSSPLLPFYRSLYGETGSTSLAIARFAISFVLLLIPTTFMGATLPVLSHFLVTSRLNLGRTVGALYAVNSFGAVFGAVAAGFVLLPELGKLGTNKLAVASNLVLGVLAIAFGRNIRVEAYSGNKEENTSSASAGTGAVEASEPLSPLAVRMTVLAFGITGFAAMATQIGWTRAISLGTGSSTYAFSLIVAVFIFGLSSGGSWASRIAPHVADPLALLAKILVLVGLLGYLVSVLLGFGPLLFFFLAVWGRGMGWSWLLAGQALGIALLIFVPTFLMGATMPLTIQVAARSSTNAGRTVGTVYAVNTLGSILGSFFGGLLLLPALQIQTTLELMALLYVLPGVVLFALSPSRRIKRQIGVVAAMIAPLLLLAILGSRWDQRLMSSGIYLLNNTEMIKAAQEFRILDAMPNLSKDCTLLYYNEGVEATVAVMKIRENLSLRVGGKPDASSYGDMPTQVSLTLVPEILHAKGPEDVLIIGLGSGASTGAALGSESVKRVDVVEMSPQVVEASSLFAPYNGLTYTQPPAGVPAAEFHPWIATPKVNVLVNDGRNHLLLTSRSYDVIASEPSNPWMAGVGNLFTEEAFELCHRRLKPGGIMCQWIHSYRLENAHYYSVVHTFAKVFKYVQVWQAREVDFMLVGSDEPLQVPLSRLRERLAQPGIKRWLEPVRMARDSEFMASFLADDDLLRARSKDALLHTDDNMLLEFQAPRSLFGSPRVFHSTTFHPLPERDMDFAGIESRDLGEFFNHLDLSVAARNHFRHSIEGPGQAAQHHRAAFVLDPYQLFAAEQQNSVDQERAGELLAGVSEKHPPDPAAAVKLMQESQERSKGLLWSRQQLNLAMLKLAQQLIKEKKPDEALAVLDKIGSSDVPSQTELLRSRAMLLKKDYPAAISLSQVALKQGAGFYAAEVLVSAQIASGDKPAAMNTLQSVIADPRSRSEPSAAPLWGMLADLNFEQGKIQEAISALYIAESVDPRNPAYGMTEARIHLSQNRPFDAIQALWIRAASDPLDRDLKSDLARTLLDVARKVRGDNKTLATDLLFHARRVSREITVLQPDWAPGWELLCQCFLATETCDDARASFWHTQTLEAYATLSALNKGDLTKMPKDLLNALQPAASPPR